VARDFIPHDYQHDIINWIATHKRCAVWAQMGSGKSVSTLTALEALSMSEDIYPVLVLATLRVAKVTWPDEIEKWNHLKHLRVSVMSKAMPVRRQRAVETEADLYFCNYEILPWLIEYFEEQGKPWPFKTIVADEATRLKSFRLRQGSKRAKALAKVAHDYSDRFIQLTGTPSPNGLRICGARCGSSTRASASGAPTRPSSSGGSARATTGTARRRWSTHRRRSKPS